MAKESREFLLLFTNHVEAVEIKQIVHVIVKIEDMMQNTVFDVYKG
jgi:hypothetical protein